MPISFNHIPANWRVPLYWVEVDGSKAGLPIIIMPSLIVGGMNQSGTGTAKGVATPNVPVLIASQAQADYNFGRGSQLANMFKAYFANNFASEVFGMPMAEGTALATGTITVATAATTNGTFDLYIAGININVGVGATDTPTIIAANIAAAINANLDIPVTAIAAVAVVTVTARSKGNWGNDIKFTDNYYGAIGGEVMPPGMTVTYVPMAGGTGDPVFTTAISNMGENEYEFVALPYTDATSLTAWEAEYGFSDTGRWGWMRQHFGHIFSGKRDTTANLIAFGNTRNSAQVAVMAIELGSPTPIYEWTAAYTAKAARALMNDPARPLQSLHLEGVLPAPGLQRFLLSELNTLSLNGLSTQMTKQDGIPMISRESTMYDHNLYGASDDAFELVTTLATLAKLLRNQRQVITSKYPRHKLADDGTRFGAGQAIVTPKIIMAELVAQYAIDEFNGLVENSQAFKANLIVERDPNDPNRLNVLYPPDLINQLRIFAVLAQFRLQYDRGIDVSIL